MIILLSLLDGTTFNPLDLLQQLPEQTLHQITFFSIVMGVIGFLYVSVDLLNHRKGVLRWMLQVTMPMFITSVLPWIGTFIFWRIPATRNTIMPYFLAASVVAAGIGFFHGLLVTGEEPVKELAKEKRTEVKAVEEKLSAVKLSLEEAIGFFQGVNVPSFAPIIDVAPVLEQKTETPSSDEGAKTSTKEGATEVIERGKKPVRTRHISDKGCLVGFTVGFIAMPVYAVIITLVIYSAFQTSQSTADTYFTLEVLAIAIATALLGGILASIWSGWLRKPEESLRDFLHRTKRHSHQWKKQHLLKQCIGWGIKQPVRRIVAWAVEPPTEEEFSVPLRPPYFSKRDGLLGLVFWGMAVLILYLIGILLYTLSSGPLDGPTALQLGIVELLLAAVFGLFGGFAAGIARFIYWVAHYSDPKKLGSLGLLLTLLSFSMQLVEPVASLQPKLSEQSSVSTIVWSHDGNRIASADTDGRIRVWDTATGSLISTFSGTSGPVDALAWSADDALIASAGDDGSVEVWQAANGTITGTLPAHISPFADAPVQALAWAPVDIPGAEPYVAVGRKNSDIVQVWNTSTADLYSYESCSRIQNSPGNTSSTGNTAADNGITALAWSSDGLFQTLFLASTSDDGLLTLCDGFAEESGKSSDPTYYPTYYDGYAGKVDALAWSSDYTHLLRSVDKNIIQVWDINAAAIAPQTTDYLYFVHGTITSWSPDGTLLAVADQRNVDIFNKTSKRPVSSYRENFSPVNAIAWSADRAYIASSDTDGAIEIWDASNGNHIASCNDSG